MYNSSINYIVSLKKLIDAIVWLIGELTLIPKQKYVTVITKTVSAGGILANSENQKVLSLKNLHIQLSIQQEVSDISCKYTKLTKSLFQEYHLLTGNLLCDKGIFYGVK